jgi:hypothetical protein
VKQQAGGIGRTDEMSNDGAGEGVGVLVIHTWRESDAEHPFRARVTYGRAADDAPATVVTTDPDEVVNTVRRWLTEVSAPGTDY